MKKPQFNFSKINLYKASKYFSSLSLVAVVLILSFFMIFLYNNVHNTLNYATELTELRTKVTEEEINVMQFEKIISHIDNKTKISTSTPPTNNPFIKRY